MVDGITEDKRLLSVKESRWKRDRLHLLTIPPRDLGRPYETVKEQPVGISSLSWLNTNIQSTLTVCIFFVMTLQGTLILWYETWELREIGQTLTG